MQEWLTEVMPQDLAARVRDLTAQDYWSVWGQERRDARYERLAEELLSSPETFRGLAEWFESSAARSASRLAFRVGRLDADGRLVDIIGEWLRADRCRAVVIGYLNGTAARTGELPAEWAANLDALVTDRPELVAAATASADVSERGFERLLGLLGRLPAPASQYLRPLAFGDWLRVLGPAQRVRVGEALVGQAEAGDPEAVDIGVDLVQMWTHGDSGAFDGTLAAVALQLVSKRGTSGRGRDFHAWLETLRLLCPLYPRQVAQILIDLVSTPGNGGMWHEDEVAALLAQVAATDPRAVMEVVGAALLDESKVPIFGVAVFKGLFETIGLPAVAAWLEQHGREHLRWLARHFAKPFIDESGHPVVPPLTEWLFREHEADEEAIQWFLMGSHSGGVWSEADTDPEKKRRELQPFMNHELRRVREWAASEIDDEERQAAWFREMREEEERR